MKQKALISELLERVSYDPLTGDLRWKGAPPRGGAKSKIVAAGSIDVQGYHRINIKYRTYYVHRLAWLFVYGSWPNGLIDHIDGNRANNAIANLRVADDHQNAANRRLNNKNKSGAAGVFLRHGKWNARIKVKGKNINLGLFATKEAAASARNAAAKAHYGDYAKLHNPRDPGQAS